jgi:RNA polymerase sigma-70 factor (ECF subfamily)
MGVEDIDAEDAKAAKLVERFQAGDMEAFGDLYSLYFDRVFAYLRLMLKSTHDAEDLAQESFTRALEALPDYEQRGRKPFRAWLFVVVKNNALKHLRKQARIEPMDPAEIARLREAQEPPEPELEALKWITDKDMLIFVERLPLPQRQVLLLRFLLDLPAKQIGEVLDRTPEDIRILQHRATKFLKARLEAVGKAPSEKASAKDTERDGNGMKRWEKQAPVLRERRWALM